MPVPDFTPKDWKNVPNTSTPLTAEALEDLESRVAEYAKDAAETAASEVLSDGSVGTADLAAGAVTAAKVAADVATQAELDAVAAARAPLASPALTGSPTAPTQVEGDNSTKLATTAYADRAVSTLSDSVANKAQSNTFSASQRIDGRFTVGNDATASDANVRVPFRSTQVVDAAQVIGSGEDTLPHVFNSVLKGDFSALSVTNPGYAWGFNHFATTGTGLADGNGLSNLTGNLSEMSIRSGRNARFGWVVGATSEAAFIGANADAQIAKAFSHQVLAPKRKDGATATRVVTDGATTAGSKNVSSATANYTAGDIGKSIKAPISSNAIPAGVTIENVTNATTAVMSAPATANTTGLTLNIGTGGVADIAYGLWVEAVPAGTLGSTDAYSVWVDGGKTGINGPVTAWVDAAGSDPLAIKNNAGSSTLARIDQNGVYYGLQLRTINTKANVREDQGGGVFEAVPAVNPMYAASTGTWKLYFRPGTNANTAKLCCMGESGTQTVILDNIPK